MVRANDGSQWGSFTSFTVTPPPNAAPPAGTKDTLVMLRNADGAYEFYDIGQNKILLDGPLGQINPALQVAGVGGFDGSDTADLLMRDPATGAFTLYDVSNNNITGNVPLGQVGPEWTVVGRRRFLDPARRDRHADAQHRIAVHSKSTISATMPSRSAGPMGQVGLEWTVAGFGDFSTRANETDMLMRNSNTGAFEVYDISNNTITSRPADGPGRAGVADRGLWRFLRPAPTRPTCCCATATPAHSRSTTSSTTRSRRHSRWARSGWSGRLRASAISPAMPTKPTC